MEKSKQKFGASAKELSEGAQKLAKAAKESAIHFENAAIAMNKLKALKFNGKAKE